MAQLKVTAMNIMDLTAITPGPGLKLEPQPKDVPPCWRRRRLFEVSVPRSAGPLNEASWEAMCIYRPEADPMPWPVMHDTAMAVLKQHQHDALRNYQLKTQEWPLCPYHGKPMAFGWNLPSYVRAIGWVRCEDGLHEAQAALKDDVKGV